MVFTYFGYAENEKGNTISGLPRASSVLLLNHYSRPGTMSSIIDNTSFELFSGSSNISISGGELQLRSNA